VNLRNAVHGQETLVRSGVMNELGHCHDAAASCVRPTAPQLKNHVCGISADPNLISNFPDSEKTVLHDQCPHFVNDVSILAR
jgi:hypothetical protein